MHYLSVQRFFFFVKVPKKTPPKVFCDEKQIPDLNTDLKEATIKNCIS